jgi:hypothetical protein
MFQLILKDDTNTFTIFSELFETEEEAERAGLEMLEDLESIVDYQILPAMLSSQDRSWWIDQKHSIKHEDQLPHWYTYQ